MKIFAENAVYVQKNDMSYLNSSGLDIPTSIFMKVFGHGITIIDNSNRYEFIKFDDPREVEFFAAQDWIIDYNALKDLTEDELIAIGTSVSDLKKSKVEAFNAKRAKKRREQYNAILAALDLLDYKMYSLRDLIMFKRGELEFALPNGVEKPAITVTEQVEVEPTLESTPSEQQSKERGIKKFIKSIFRKENNK